MYAILEVSMLTYNILYINESDSLDIYHFDLFHSHFFLKLFLILFLFFPFISFPFIVAICLFVSKLSFTISKTRHSVSTVSNICFHSCAYVVLIFSISPSPMSLQTLPR